MRSAEGTLPAHAGRLKTGMTSASVRLILATLNAAAVPVQRGRPDTSLRLISPTDPFGETPNSHSHPPPGGEPGQPGGGGRGRWFEVGFQAWIYH